jgi:hypothetical protein
MRLILKESINCIWSYESMLRAFLYLFEPEIHG